MGSQSGLSRSPRHRVARRCASVETRPASKWRRTDSVIPDAAPASSRVGQLRPSVSPNDPHPPHPSPSRPHRGLARRSTTRLRGRGPAVVGADAEGAHQPVPVVAPLPDRDPTCRRESRSVTCPPTRGDSGARVHRTPGVASGDDARLPRGADGALAFIPTMSPRSVSTSSRRECD